MAYPSQEYDQALRCWKDDWSMEYSPLKDWDHEHCLFHLHRMSSPEYVHNSNRNSGSGRRCHQTV